MPVCMLFAQTALLARLAAPFPFAVGETLQYEATLGVFPIGTASVTVTGMAKERGKEAFVFTATGQGGPPGIRARYDLTSWVGTSRLQFTPFHRRLVQGNSVQEEHYQIIPIRVATASKGKPEDWVAPSDPLDELAFLYYLRTMPMKVGKTLPALRATSRRGTTRFRSRSSRTRFRPPASGASVPVLVVEVTTRGTTVGVRFTDDARRLPVQLDLPLPYGSVTLELTSGA